MRAGYSVTKNLIVSAFILKSRQINRAKEPCEHAKPNSRKGESKPGPACSEPD